MFVGQTMVGVITGRREESRLYISPMVGVVTGRREESRLYISPNGWSGNLLPAPARRGVGGGVLQRVGKQTFMPAG